MNTTWMDGQSMLSFYQAFLTLLVWLLATLTCLGVVASVALVCHECRPFSGPASQFPKPHFEIDFKNWHELGVVPEKPPAEWRDEMNKA